MAVTRVVLKNGEVRWRFRRQIHGKNITGTRLSKLSAEESDIKLKLKQLSGADPEPQKQELLFCYKSYFAWIKSKVSNGTRSANYLKSLKYAARNVLDFALLQGIIFADDLSFSFIDSYIQHRRNAKRISAKPISGQTVLNEFRALHSALNWCVSRSIIKKNPIRGYKFDTIVHYLPDLPTPKEIQKIFDNLCDYDTKKAIYFILATGCRASEFCALRKEDCRETIKFHRDTKGRYTRYAPMPDLPFDLPEKGLAFTREGKVWNKNILLRRLHKACETADVHKVNIHTLRHCYATYQLALETNVYEIMSAGGWKSFAVFQRYVDAARRYDITSYLPKFSGESDIKSKWGRQKVVKNEDFKGFVIPFKVAVNQ